MNLSCGQERVTMYINRLPSWGARTLIDDGVNGYIVPTRDPLALANKMIFILDHPDEAVNYHFTV